MKYFSRIQNLLDKYEIPIIFAILLIGLVIRLAVIITIEEPIDRDALEYYTIAKNLNEHHRFSIDGENPTIRRSPGYPFFLAFFMKIVGTNPNHLYTVQALINILTIWIVYLALKQIGANATIRIIAILLFTFNPSFIYVNTFYAEIFTMFIMSLLIYLTINQELFKNKNWNIILQGILIGVLVLIRPTFLYLPIFILVVSIFIRIFFHNKKMKDALITAIIAIITLVPWTIRNRIIFNEWIPTESSSGLALWQANLEIENRTVWYSVTDIAKYEQQRTASAELQSKLRSEYLQKYDINSLVELNQFLEQKAIEIILRHPIRYCILCVNRFLIFWFSPPIGSTTLKAISPVIFVLALLFRYLITILGICGLWQFARRDFSGSFILISLVVYLTILHSATHAIQRYFLPLIPVLYFALGYFLNNQKSLNCKERQE